MKIDHFLYKYLEFINPNCRKNQNVNPGSLALCFVFFHLVFHKAFDFLCFRKRGASQENRTTFYFYSFQIDDFMMEIQIKRDLDSIF